MNNKERFLQICTENINREGINELLKWLETSDFFYCPASTKYHGNYEGGLLEHSLNVYDNFLKILPLVDFEDNNPPTQETIAIITLFHDLCKVNFYKKGLRNVKGEDGKWFSKEVYEVDEKVPLGHGEKSCMLIQQFMRLSIDELLAIRWHMGGFDSATKGGDYGMSGAQEKTKLVTMLQVADALSTLQEKKIN